MKVSVVIPVFESNRILDELFCRLKSVLGALGEDWEVIMVDDGSGDGSYEVMQKIRSSDKRLKIIQFVRNLGQHQATLCGLRYSSGEYVITMDDDLQQPPEEIPKILSKLGEGFDVVIGKIDDKKHSLFRNIGSRTIRLLSEIIVSKPKNLYLSSFKGFSRRAVNLVTRYKGAHPFLAALIFRSVPHSSVTNVDVEHAHRRHGEGGYNLLKLFRLSSYLVFLHSGIPFRSMLHWGTCLNVIGTISACSIAAGMKFSRHIAGRWYVAALLILFFFGNILLVIGLLGEYAVRADEKFRRHSEEIIYQKDIT